MSVSLFHKLTTKAFFLTATSLAILAGGVASYMRHAVVPATPPIQSQRIPVQTSSKSLRLSDARTIESNGADLTTGMARSLTSADFDEDGTPDVIGGYANGGVGYFSFYRGNVEAIYPTATTSAEVLPFFAASLSVNLPVTPDFLVAGDFNADGHSDVLAAAQGGNTLALLAGDGKGGFAEAQSLTLDGAVTALEAGEINRVDGLADFAVGLTTDDSARVLVFAARAGAWQATPQSYELAQPATSLAFAQLTGDSYADLAVAGGKELVTLAGGATGGATMSRQPLKSPVISLAVGRFTESATDQLALLGRDGAISIATHSAADTTARAAARRASKAEWQVQTRLTDTPAKAVAPAQLLRARLSGGKADELLLWQGNQLQVAKLQPAAELATASLAQSTDVVAALPLRLNASAAQGLVLLGREQRGLMVVRAVPEATFAVNSVSDLPDSNPGDGACAVTPTAGNFCTLRAAIEEANATAAADTITFNIGTGTQTILLNSSLPTITNPLTIDGLTGAPATQSIVISPGPNFAGTIAMLTVTSSGNAIRGLTISGFTSLTALFLQNSNNNIIEGNTIRANSTGLLLIQAGNNQIGGTTAAARNVISGQVNDGIVLSQNQTTNNRIQGNYLGTDGTGATADANRSGISLTFAPSNTIGGTTAGARNVIAGNRGAGILLFGGLGADATTGNLIQGNYIGVAANGTGALGNGVSAGTAPTNSGIVIQDANGTTVGGTAAGAGNIIANNGARGINVPTPTSTPGITAQNNAILTNSIYSNGTLGVDLGTTGVTANDTGDGDTGANNQQNFPVLTSALTRSTGTTIAGTLNSAANASFTIELFSNAACDTSGNGEGETFVGRTNVTTSATGDASFSLVLSTPITAGRVLTATATDAAGNTSEFSACFQVQDAVADLGVTVAASPTTLTVGNNLTYDLAVTNNGPDDATGVTLTDTILIPGGQYIFVSATPSTGTCTGTGPITCNLGTLAPSGRVTVRVIVTPSIPLTPPGSGAPPLFSVTATNTANVTAVELDRVTTNNSANAAATVNALADLAVTQTVNPPAPTSGGVLTYTINITNNGPSTAGLLSGRIDPPVQLLNATCTAPAGWSCNRDGNPFFISATSQVPGTVQITIRGTVACLGQNTALTSTATIGSQTNDSITANNTSTVTNTAAAGTAVGTITYDAGGTALALGPVVAGSTSTPPSGTITLTNTGCLPMTLGNAFFARVTNAANLSGLDDSRYFSLRLIPASGAEIPLTPTANPDRNAPQPIAINRTLFSGEQLRFRILFNPPLPFFAGSFAARDTGVFATQVLPDLFDSQLRFNFVTTSPGFFAEAIGDAGTAVANLTARVSPAIQIVARDGNAIGNPATTPLVDMTTIRDDFRVRVSLYDANKNATRITYQFFDTYRQVASSPIEVSLTPILSALAGLLPGQPFTVQQDFSGAAGRPDIVYVRVVVNDGDGTTVSASSSPFIPSLAATSNRLVTEGIFADVIQLPLLPIASRIELKAQREK